MDNILAVEGGIVWVAGEQYPDVSWMIEGMDTADLTDSNIETTVRHNAEMNKEYGRGEADEDDIQQAIMILRKIRDNR